MRTRSEPQIRSLEAVADVSAPAGHSHRQLLVHRHRELARGAHARPPSPSGNLLLACERITGVATSLATVDSRVGSGSIEGKQQQLKKRKARKNSCELLSGARSALKVGLVEALISTAALEGAALSVPTCAAFATAEQGGAVPFGVHQLPLHAPLPGHTAGAKLH
eukprot:6213604-Pleurochrysis_carterae.AAC.2